MDIFNDDEAAAILEEQRMVLTALHGRLLKYVQEPNESTVFHALQGDIRSIEIGLSLKSRVHEVRALRRRAQLRAQQRHGARRRRAANVGGRPRKRGRQ